MSRPASSRVLASEPLGSARVLIIDDDACVLEALSVAVDFLGGLATAVPSAVSARGVLEKADVDMIFCDITMPGEDGCQFLARLRREERARGIGPLPAVAVTAIGWELEVLQAAGFQEVLRKPFGIDDVRRVMASLLATR